MTKLTIITLGESGVGKTSLLNRFKTGKFREALKSTFVDHFSKTITVENIRTCAIIWDTAGQERYNSLIKRYYAMADGVILMYDVNNVLSFSKLSRWLSELKSENETAEIIIVGNKNEDPTKKLISSLDVKCMAEEENLQYLEASAKTGENVDMIFQLLIKKILTARGMLSPPPDLENSENKLNTKSSSQSSNIKNETEISFTYYGKSEPSDITRLSETNTEELTDEDAKSKRCFPCRWF